jgi:hypothetical protein
MFIVGNIFLRTFYKTRLMGKVVYVGSGVMKKGVKQQRKTSQ